MTRTHDVAKSLLGLALASAWALHPAGADAAPRSKSKSAATAAATTSTAATPPSNGAIDIVIGRAPSKEALATSTTKDALISEAIDKGKDKGSDDESKSSGTTSSFSGEKQIVVITVTGEVTERERFSLFGGNDNSLRTLMDMLRRIRDDKSVVAAVLRFSNVSMSYAQACELRGAIAQVRERGKHVSALLEDEGQPPYFTALACDEIIMPPSGGLSLLGVQANNYFMRGLLAKLGMQAEFLHQGQYKSFGETLERDDFTTPAQKNMEEIVDSVYGEMVNAIATKFNVSVAEAKSQVDNGPATASEAMKRHLIDHVRYLDEHLEWLKRAKDNAKVVTAAQYDKAGRSKVGGDEPINPFSLLMGMSRGAATRPDAGSSRYPQVALVYATGSINQGGSPEGFESTDEVLADDMIRTLDEIQKDRKIKAVLLRIDSPGGSAFASDLIWKKIRDIRKDKPVIASMGTVAASGGYYIAMAADKIVATSGTLTGSIGVVGGKINLSGTYDRIGITKRSISRGAYSDLYSESKLFSEKERKLLDAQMGAVYQDFVAKVAECRRLPQERVQELAQGRVWTGADALGVGLVDSTGGLTEAITETKRQIGLKPEDKVALVSYPKEKTLMDLLQRMFQTSGADARIGGLTLQALATREPELAAALRNAPRGLRECLGVVLQLPKWLQQERVALVAPATFELR